MFCVYKTFVPCVCCRRAAEEARPAPRADSEGWEGTIPEVPRSVHWRLFSRLFQHRRHQRRSVRTPAQSPSVWSGSGSVVIMFMLCFRLSTDVKSAEATFISWCELSVCGLLILWLLSSGWTPSTFVSSRQQKTEKHHARPEDFMDEEVEERFYLRLQHWSITSWK